MALSNLQDLVIKETEELRSWFWGALTGFEARTTKQITSLEDSVILKFQTDLGPTAEIHRLWKYFELIAMDSVDDPEHIGEELGISADPALEFGEHALVIGLVLADQAALLSKNRTHKSDVLTLLCHSEALEARSFWNFFRGVTRCRSPDQATQKAENHLQAFEFKSWQRAKQSEFGRKGALSRHNQPGGTIETKNKIRELWASGKYQSRSQCAEREHRNLGISFETARRALRNTRDPDK